MKKTIKLDDNHSIISDKFCWVLHYEAYKDKPDGSGKSKSEDNWYYGDIKHALKSYADKYLKGCESITEVIERIESLEEKIDNLEL